MKKFFFITLIFLTTSCGYKIVDLSEKSNFNIVELSTSGDKKINYILKNNIFSSKKENAKSIILNIDTKKIKEIKEKNIKNEITKYNITIIADVEIRGINQKFTLKESGVFRVASQNSITRSNEKNLISLLAKELANEIVTKITSSLNDI